MLSSVPILLACAIALISPSTAEVTVHHTTTKTVFKHACPNPTLYTSGYPTASTNRTATTLSNSTTTDLCPTASGFVRPSPTGTVPCTPLNGIGTSCVQDSDCCWPLWCDITVDVCLCPGQGNDMPYPITSTTSIPSKATPTPPGECTLPSSVGADCLETGQCCSPLWCDTSRYLCAFPGGGGSSLSPLGGSSIATFSTALAHSQQ